MTKCPMCKYEWDKETDDYIKLKKEIIQELIEFLEKERDKKI